jgi:hypothetical protein
MSVKKAEAARILNVSKARVTQYVKAGMPVRPDGSVDIAEAQAWVAKNIDPAKRAGWLAVGPSSPTTDPFAIVAEFDRPEHRGFAYAVANAVYTAGAYAVMAAADADVDRDRARKLAELVALLVWQNLEDAGRAIGMAPAKGQGIFALHQELLNLKLERALAMGLFDADGRSVVAGASRATG